MKKFNVTGLCIQEKHYMVDISDKIAKIMELIDDRQYFTINRARQYGKTTTLFKLAKSLPYDYTCISLSFEGVGQTMFEGPAAFCQRFLLHVSKALENIDESFAGLWPDESITDFDLLGFHLDKLCKDRKIILLIDEVDQVSDNQVFLHFLGMLRSKYLARENGYTYTFHSVILAGVYDIKNIKLKLIKEGLYPQQNSFGRIYNSPWNIAANFDIDLSFNPAGIEAMLFEYEAEHNSGMCIDLVAGEIYKYTSGYPFLVSRICKCIDKELNGEWTRIGVQKAVKVILREKNVLFDDLSKNLENNKDLYDFLYALLIVGERKSYIIDVPVIEWCSMFGYIKNRNGDISSADSGYAVISNKIFEMRMSNYFASKDENASRMESAVCNSLYHEVVKDGTFNMEACMRRFAEHYREIFSEDDIPFLERHGRLLFLSFLRPLVNGLGFYHIESQFTDLRRMDIVVDFGRDQFIIELKLWKGETAHDKAYEQILNYMDAKNSGKGYLLTFDFRKETNKARKADWVNVGGKQIFDVIV